MKILLAYPHEHIGACPYEGNSDVLVVNDWPRDDWPNLHLGPDPQNVKTASNVMVHHEPDLIIPLTEEAVLACGRATSTLDLPVGVDNRIAFRCSDRREQRSWLEITGLNPQWWLYGRSPFPSDIKLVAKAPASTLSRGVKFLEANKSHDYLQIARDVYEGARKEVSRLVLADHVPAYPMVLEEFVEGPQYEVCGISTDDVVFCFRPLLQHWSEDGTKIQEYEPIDQVEFATELTEAAIRAVRALGINWAGWCVELRGPPWHVIEVHCRLGEDGGNYNKALDPEMNPVERLVLTFEAHS